MYLHVWNWKWLYLAQLLWQYCCLALYPHHMWTYSRSDTYVSVDVLYPRFIQLLPKTNETSSTVRLQSTFPLSLGIFWIFARKVAENVSAETGTFTVILAWCPMLPSGVYLTSARLSKIACLSDNISTLSSDSGSSNRSLLSLHELGLFIFLVTNDWSSGLCSAEIQVFGPSQSFHFTRYSFPPFSPRSSSTSSTSHNF